MRSWYKYILLPISVFLLVYCNWTKEKLNTEDMIQVWYGHDQKLGVIGNAQKQINILGNIKLTSDDLAAYYTLNGDDRKNWLTLGPDLHRLAKKGDFNIDIYRTKLKEGENLVKIFVVQNDKILDTEEIKVEYSKNKQWPLPYEIRWNNVKNIQNVAEILDGQWELVDSGIRVKERYYDRIVAVGDSTWQNYEVMTSVIFHDFTTPSEGPPTYNVTHVAIASRWPGHDQDSLQPNRKWYPLGATSEFRITSDYDSCRWRIFDGGNLYSEQADSLYRTIQPEVKYFMKHRVESISPTKTLYSVKFWDAKEVEPSGWDLQATEESEHPEKGSACLIAHHTDVTFGDVSIIPVE